MGRVVFNNDGWVAYSAIGSDDDPFALSGTNVLKPDEAECVDSFAIKSCDPAFEYRLCHAQYLQPPEPASCLSTRIYTYVCFQ